MQHYGEARYAERIARIGRAVDANGGALLDLHRALPQDAFRDLTDHYTAAGTDRMATLVWAALGPLLPDAERRSP